MASLIIEQCVDFLLTIGSKGPHVFRTAPVSPIVVKPPVCNLWSSCPTT